MPDQQRKEWVTAEDEYAEEERLPVSVLVQARSELREQAGARQEALRQMRDWLRKNPRILSSRLDCSFLLRFLRCKKMSVPQAQEALERYLLLRQSQSKLLHGLDCQRTELAELFSKGVVFAAPGTDSQGRRIIIIRPGQFDPYKYSQAEVCRLAGIVIETLLEDEALQVTGFVYFCDATGFTFPHLTLFTPRECVRIAKNGERTIPMRHKQIIGFNVSSSVKIAVDFVMSLVSEKIRQRVKVCTSVQEAHQYVDVDLLPREYGGVMPMDDMIALWKEEMAAQRVLLLSHDRMRVQMSLFTNQEREGSVSALRAGGAVVTCGDKYSTHSGGISGSFRKLEVD